MTLLHVENLGKAFRSYASVWHRFGTWFGLPLTPSEEQWVLRHVNFDMAPGEALGIIGQNGAGKSTMLKLIAGILHPTEGRTLAHGRISAILELGMGFNPELTGRQNASHTAGLMGFNARQIETSMPGIEAFAELGEYFDRPLRTYSSGMQVRLAFSVATANRPEILIVDEAFSVGDTYFQHKSFNRIRQFRQEGTALLIVSHDINAILSLCDRAILLNDGTVVQEGSPEAVADFYNAIIAEKENSTVKIKRHSSGKSETTSGTGEARIAEIKLLNSKGVESDFIEVGEQIALSIKVRVLKDIASLVFGYGIKDRFGQVMYGTNTWHTGQVVHNPKAGDAYHFKINFAANLGVGSYSIQTALSDRETHLTANYEWWDMAVVFNVVNRDKVQFAGCLWNEPSISVEQITK